MFIKELRNNSKSYVIIVLILACNIYSFELNNVVGIRNSHHNRVDRATQSTTWTLRVSSLERDQQRRDGGKYRPEDIVRDGNAISKTGIASRGTTMPGFTTAAHIISSNEKEEEDEGETWRSGATMEAGGDVLGLDASQVEEVAPGVSQTSQAATSKVNGEASSDLSASSTPLFATKIAAAATATATTTTTSKKHHYNNIFRNDQSLVKNGGKTSKRKTKTKSQMKATQNYMYRKSNTVPESLLEFVAEIHEQDRITPLEEVLLGEKTQAAIELQSIHTSLAEELGRPPSDGEWCARAGNLNVQALEDILSEGLEAKNKLVTSNLRLVQRVVNVYIRNGLSSQYNAGDLMQEGTIALIRAAEKFQPSKGFRFSTYAMFWIRASVKRSQLSQSREISVPQRVQEVYKKMQIVKKDIEDRGDKPVMQEIANIMGVKVEVLEKAERAMSQKTYR